MLNTDESARKRRNKIKAAGAVFLAMAFGLLAYVGIQRYRTERAVQEAQSALNLVQGALQDNLTALKAEWSAFDVAVSLLEKTGGLISELVGLVKNGKAAVDTLQAAHESDLLEVARQTYSLTADLLKATAEDLKSSGVQVAGADLAPQLLLADKAGRTAALLEYRIQLERSEAAIKKNLNSILDKSAAESDLKAKLWPLQVGASDFSESARNLQKGREALLGAAGVGGPAALGTLLTSGVCNGPRDMRQIAVGSVLIEPGKAAQDLKLIPNINPDFVNALQEETGLLLSGTLEGAIAAGWANKYGIRGSGGYIPAFMNPPTPGASMLQTRNSTNDGSPDSTSGSETNSCAAVSESSGASTPLDLEAGWWVSPNGLTDCATCGPDSYDGRMKFYRISASEYIIRDWKLLDGAPPFEISHFWSHLVKKGNFYTARFTVPVSCGLISATPPHDICESRVGDRSTVWRCASIEGMLFQTPATPAQRYRATGESLDSSYTLTLEQKGAQVIATISDENNTCPEQSNGMGSGSGVLSHTAAPTIPK